MIWNTNDEPKFFFLLIDGYVELYYMIEDKTNPVVLKKNHIITESNSIL